MLGYYLMFNRNCEEALKTYEKAFNAKTVEMQKYGDIPSGPEVLDADKDLVLHARLQIDGMEIMCADSLQRGAVSGENMYISVTTKDEEMVKKAWEILSENGKTYMELTPTFFASLHGSLKDRFGVNWMFTALK